MIVALLQRIFGNVPGGIWLLLFGLVTIWFVVWYVYHFSGIMTKKRFLQVGSLTTLLWLILFLFFSISNPLPPKKKRVLFTFHSVPSIDSSFARSYISAQNLYFFFSKNLPLEQFLVASPDWGLAVGNWQEFTDVEFQHRLLAFLKGNFAFSVGAEKPELLLLKIDSNGNLDTLQQWSSFPTSIESLGKVFEIFGSKLHASEVNFEITSSPSALSWAKGRLAYLIGDLSEARRFLTTSLTYDNRFSPALLDLAKIELDSARYLKSVGGYFQDHLAAANGYLQRLKRQNSEFPELWLWTGNYHILFENFVMAEQELKKAVRFNPNNELAYFFLSRLHPSRYSELGFHGEEALFKYALYINPASIPVRLWYGDFLIRQNRKDEAERIYLDFVSGLAHHFDLDIALVKLYISERRYDDALRLLERSRGQFPDRTVALDFHQGVVLFFKGDTAQAETILSNKQVVENFPDALLYLGFIAEKRGDLETAIACFRERIRRNRGLNDPFKEEARKHLVKLLQKSGEQGR